MATIKSLLGSRIQKAIQRAANRIESLHRGLANARRRDTVLVLKEVHRLADQQIEEARSQGKSATQMARAKECAESGLRAAQAGDWEFAKHLESRALEAYMASDVERGQRVREGAHRGHEKSHGSTGSKERRWGQYQCAIEEMLERSPSLSVTEARCRVAKEHGVHPKTVERHTENPRKK